MPIFQMRGVQQKGPGTSPGGLHCEQLSRGPRPQGSASSASVRSAQGPCDRGEWGDGHWPVGTSLWPCVPVLSLPLAWSVLAEHLLRVLHPDHGS